MVHLDVSSLEDWLGRANARHTEMQAWWAQPTSMVGFANFWLVELADEKRQDLVRMEYDLLHEEFKLGFQSGIETGVVTEAALVKLLRAVLQEFPNVFGGGDGTAFLDLVRTLAGDKGPRFRTLMSAVKCSTTNTQYAQWLLAARSFALVTMVSSVTDFYRRVAEVADGTVSDPAQTRPPSADAASRARARAARPATATAGNGRSDAPGPARPGTAAASRVNVKAVDEAFIAAKTGQCEVLYYMLTRALVELDVTDGLGRTLLMAAVQHDQIEMIGFLLENSDRIDLDAVAGPSGNTALHIAASTGHADIVEMLLAAGADPSVTNPISNATARDVAEVFGHNAVLAHFERIANTAAS